MLEPHARGHAKGGGNGREHRNGYLQNLLPNIFLHDLFVDSFFFKVTSE